MIAEAIINAAAVGGIAILWVEFTFKAIETSLNILFPPKQLHYFRCEHCSNNILESDGSHRAVFNQNLFVCHRCAEKELVCEECQEIFLDDLEVLE